MDGGRGSGGGAWNNRTSPSPSPRPPNVEISSSAVNLMSVIAVLIVAILFAVALAGANVAILHQIPEGHVGVYWRGGALLKTITGPGFHSMIPFLTEYEAIQTTIQTDQVRDIPCGTKGGVMISFEKIEVVNRLNKEYVYDTILEFGVSYDKTWIYDKIHHEINQFCSSHSLQEVYIDKFDQIDEIMKEAIQRDCTRYAPGIEIIGVRVTKPKIPASIARNYEIMEEERTKVLIAVEKQKVVEKEAETIKKRAVTDAERDAKVSEILMAQRVMEKESTKKQEEIENQIYLARERSLADANFYRVLREAEANKLKLTPEFLELKFIEAIANNTKMFFGEKIPSMVMDQRLLGNLLESGQAILRQDFQRLGFYKFSKLWIAFRCVNEVCQLRKQRERSDRSIDNLDDAPTKERCTSAGSLPFSNAVVARRCGSADEATALAIGRLLVAPLLFVALLRFVSYSLRLRFPSSHALRSYCCSFGTLLEALRTHCRSVGTLTLEALRSCFDFIAAVGGGGAAATDVCSHGSFSSSRQFGGGACRRRRGAGFFLEENQSEELECVGEQGVRAFEQEHESDPVLQSDAHH